MMLLLCRSALCCVHNRENPGHRGIHSIDAAIGAGMVGARADVVDVKMVIGEVGNLGV